MKLESMKMAKFAPLNNDQMTIVTGGADTGAGREEMGTYSINTPCEGSGTGTTYYSQTMTKIRTWTSDAMVDGRMCYWGEGYGWVEANH
ncbi:hypothetical protein ACLOAU_02530 [Niabella sp. CJ426]|uniref:hypothetical protein n=1 Tax=Niabella sp. CJ426 TaxID=3393740 RepID=UPI003D080505